MDGLDKGNGNGNVWNTESTEFTEPTQIRQKRCFAYPCWFGDFCELRVLAVQSEKGSRV